MPDALPTSELLVEVYSPDGSRRFVPVNQSPFFIGRGDGTGNHLQLSDQRISRKCAAIVTENGRCQIQDLGHRYGIFVNGQKVDKKVLANGDVITFGLDESSYKLKFQQIAQDITVQTMLTRIGGISQDESLSGGLGKLRLLLEATSLLHSQLPLDSVLGTMVDHAISITNADRGLLLEGGSLESLRVRLARGKGAQAVPIDGLKPSQTALRQALEQKASVITEDLNRGDLKLQAAQSIIAQSLRAVVAVPLYAKEHLSTQESPIRPAAKHLLGVVYLDSRRPAAFSKLDRQILDALAVEAASILDNARLVERERERQRMEQELSIARQIQQALLPRGFRDFPHFEITGIHKPCLDVGGDYFDVFPISDEKTAILIADVSGKGLGAALLTTMLQGALSGMTLGVSPARVFNHINHFLCEHADVRRYATMFFGILERNGRFEFINAGHPPPLLLRDGEVKDLSNKGSTPVGLFEESEYVAHEEFLLPGDVLALFSDGITEAMDPERELYGDERLSEALAGQGSAALDDLQKTVLKSVESFTQGASQADDLTLLLVRYRGDISREDPPAGIARGATPSIDATRER
jgi:serine phosphatase RsbU (regulator of sigma subunit)